jgi:hypothetical protein
MHHRTQQYKPIWLFCFAAMRERTIHSLYLFIDRPGTCSIFSTVEQTMDLGHEADDIPHVTVNAPDDFR